jgi:DNA-binding MarR family transcriptional regulator
MLKRTSPSNPFIALIDEIYRLNGRLNSIFTGVKATTGLSAMESTVLAAVVESPFAPTVPQIGRSLGHSRQVIRRAAEALIAARLIETLPNPHHKRAALLRATAQGTALQRKADAHATKAIRAVLRGVDAGKCRRMADELRALRGELEAFLRSRKAT